MGGSGGAEPETVICRFQVRADREDEFREILERSDRLVGESDELDELRKLTFFPRVHGEQPGSREPVLRRVQGAACLSGLRSGAGAARPFPYRTGPLGSGRGTRGLRGSPEQATIMRRRCQSHMVNRGHV